MHAGQYDGHEGHGERMPAVEGIEAEGVCVADECDDGEDACGINEGNGVEVVCDIEDGSEEGNEEGGLRDEEGGLRDEEGGLRDEEGSGVERACFVEDQYVDSNNDGPGCSTTRTSSVEARPAASPCSSWGFTRAASVANDGPVVLGDSSRLQRATTSAASMLFARSVPYLKCACKIGGALACVSSSSSIAVQSVGVCLAVYFHDCWTRE
eukprot:GHVU01139425.1.p1 GENE.GHVU01139425.1~~GHVU01139425.1.p1  ORF type:complete len:210 (-),score=27.14 GHVU01139425.1:267-896(-)